jgi:glycosyltransferase involved in cell wall biosynthesis
MPTPKNIAVTVVLPVYNGEEYLADSIQSVLNQNLQGFEFIIIDDASNDASSTIIESFAIDKRIRHIVHTTNKGLFETLNEGVELSNSDLIKIWAQDDIMGYTCLDRLIEAYGKHPECSFYVQSSLTIGGSQKMSALTMETDLKDHQTEIWQNNKILRHFWYCGNVHRNISNLSFTKETHRSLEGFNASFVYSGDIDFIQRMKTPAQMVLERSDSIYIRDHQNQLSKSVKHLHFELFENVRIFKELEKDTPDSLKPFALKCQIDHQIPYRVSNSFQVIRKDRKLGFKMLKGSSLDYGILPCLFFWIRKKILAKINPKGLVNLSYSEKAN